MDECLCFNTLSEARWQWHLSFKQDDALVFPPAYRPKISRHWRREGGTNRTALAWPHSITGLDSAGTDSMILPTLNIVYGLLPSSAQAPALAGLS